MDAAVLRRRPATNCSVAPGWTLAQPGDTVTLTVQRPGRSRPLVITAVFRAIEGRRRHQDSGPYGWRCGSCRPILFSSRASGLAVLFLRRGRPQCLAAGAGVRYLHRGRGPAQPICRLCPLVFSTSCSAYAPVGKSVLPGLFYFFFAVFPTRSPIDRKLPWLKWLLLATGACLGWGGRFELATSQHCLSSPIMLSLSVTGLTRLTVGYRHGYPGLISLLLNMFSVTRVEDRRKLKVMLWGTLVSIGPAVLIGLPYDLLRSETPFWLIFARAVLLFVMPLSFAYAVVKHRVMDIPVLLRRSARYFLVERGFAILILIFSVGITLWFGQAFSRRFSSGSKGRYRSERLWACSCSQGLRRCSARSGRGWIGPSSAALMTRSKFWKTWRRWR